MDGAHNPDGVRAFIASVRQLAYGKHCSLIFGASSDKAVDEMTGMIADSGLFDRIAVVEYEGTRSAPTDTLLGMLKKYTAMGSSFTVTAYESVKEALDTEKKLIGDDGFLFIAGSLYLVGECRALVTAGGEKQDDRFW